MEKTLRLVMGPRQGKRAQPTKGEEGKNEEKKKEPVYQKRMGGRSNHFTMKLIIKGIQRKTGDRRGR